MRSHTRYLSSVIVLTLSLATGMQAGPVISEFMAANDTTLRDADGEYPDWIEIFNPDSTNIALNGWYLTDDSGQLDKWSFPATTLEAGTFLIVFASGKDRRVAGEELHTDFKLSSRGEYLALVRPDGANVASSFAPLYPPQLNDVSYGPEFSSESLLAKDAAVAYHVPQAADPSDWYNTSFDDSGWPRGAQGLGFSSTPEGFSVRVVRSWYQPGNVAGAETILSTPSYQDSIETEKAPAVNYYNSGGDGHYGDNRTFPGMTMGSDANNFAVEATARIVIPTAGPWTFGVNSDDGFRLTVSNAAASFMVEFDGTRGPGDSFDTFDVPEAGAYDLRLVFFEAGGGAGVELFASPGSHSTFVAQSFRLIGDVDGGGLATVGLSENLRTDVSDIMQGVNASLWARGRCSVGSPGAFDSVVVRMRYEDGFSAWLNGVQLASDHSPRFPAWDSAATTNRSLGEAVLPKDFPLAGGGGALLPGANVVAVLGLNDTASDGDFLLQVELVGSLLGVTNFYFASPSPGAPNPSGVQIGYVADVDFSVERCLTNAAFQLVLSNTTAGAQIVYTTDGSTPNLGSGTVYSAPLGINGTATIRARAVLAGYDPSSVTTHTYVFPADVVVQSPNGEIPGAGWPASSVNGQVVDYGMDPDIVNSGTYGHLVEDALRAVPTISVVTDLENLFDPSTGIYVNAGEQGVSWERRASVELIHPDGAEGFHVNAGLRIRGGFSRSDGNPKHAFRLLFREEYGVAKLRYPLFGDSGVDVFDNVDLRTSQNYSWSFQNDSRNTMVREVWNRDLQRDMGQPHTRSRYYHLYINGHYWGLYQTQERAEASFAESYLGGDKSEYDVVKVETTAGYTIKATDGDLNAWQDLWQMATDGFAADADYRRALGLNPDGSRNPAYPILVDPINLADYMIATYYAGDIDSPISNFLGNDRPNNMYTIYNRVTPDGFRSFRHDGEHTLLDNNRDRTGPWPAGTEFRYFNPQWLHQQLTANAEYKLRFADRVRKHCYDGGVLTPAKCRERFRARMGQIELAIVAESARWGDSKNATPYNQGHWSNACNWVLNTHFPVRTDITVQQLRDQGWYPSVDAPGFNQHGGVVESGFRVIPTTAEGAIYYTTDGSDPRLAGGGVNPDAQMMVPNQVTETLVVRGSTWRYLDDGSDQGTNWCGAGFDDGAWQSGPAQLGYGDGGEATVVSFGPDSENKYITTYFRHRFTATNVTEITALAMHLVRDDGAVVYLNGEEARRINLAAGAVQYDTTTTTFVGGGDESTFFEYALDPAYLVEGSNGVAVEIHQAGGTSSDISFDLEIKATRDLRGDSLVLDRSANVMARVYHGGEWSALTEAFFAVGSAVDQLRVTEVMYNPAPPPDGSPFGAGDFEFVEFKNVGGSPVDLARLRLVDGVNGVLGSLVLQTGELAVAVANLEAFGTRYDTNGMRIACVYTGQLNNGGETICVEDPFGTAVQTFAYGDWYAPADGGGYSMIVTNVHADPQTWSQSNAWCVGSLPLGTPGWDEPELVAGSVVVNEVLTHTDASTDWIELFNSTGADVDIGGWLLSDTVADLAKFVIPAGTVITGHSYAVFTAADHFSNSNHPGARRTFAFSELGEGAYLSSALAGVPTSYREGANFGAAEREVTFGRHARSDGGVDFVALAAGTAAQSNSFPRVGPVVINEIMYHPATGEYEFVELRNVTATNIALYDPGYPSNTWRLSGAVDYVLPEGAEIAGQGCALVVPTPPAFFRERYGVPAAVPIHGPYTGSLDNAGESIKLRKPGEPEPDGIVPYILVDRVKYGDKAPWPVEADGTGLALRKLAPSAYGNDPESWGVSAFVEGSPGADTALAPRWWLRLHGWTNDFDRVEQDDADSDKMATWEEYVAGTVPTNGTSVLSLFLSPEPVVGRFRLEWQGVAGRRYAVQGTDSLVHPFVNLPGAGSIPGTNGLMWARTAATNAAQMLRLKVGLE